MAMFSSGKAANIYALKNDANAMHVIRYFETRNDEPCEVTEYWVKDLAQEPSDFNVNLWKCMSDIGKFGNMLSYQRIDFD